MKIDNIKHKIFPSKDFSKHRSLYDTPSAMPTILWLAALSLGGPLVLAGLSVISDKNSLEHHAQNKVTTIENSDEVAKNIGKKIIKDIKTKGTVDKAYLEGLKTIIKSESK